MAKLAVFWDRDNTLIDDPGYLRDPDAVTLRPGAADALRTLQSAGYENIIATNQSGIARGLFDEPTLGKIHARLCELFKRDGARVDAIYYCPYLEGEDAVVPEYRRESDLRKPRPGMLVKASLERNIELAGSWSIGDSLRDCQAGRAAGCRTILVGDPTSTPQNAAKDAVDFTAGSLDEAVQIVLKHTPGYEASDNGAAPADKPAQNAPAESTALLQEILGFIRMVDRRGRAEEFSSVRLAGAIVQVAAIAAFIWAVFAMVDSQSPASIPIARLLCSLVLQTMALTFFVLSGRR
jgi:D-glycero-D-manno-heptose 1,7-bisphosphate phosphatase